MNLEIFVENFAKQFEEINTAKFTSKTKFRSIETWSSLMALSIIAMVDEEYNVKLRGNDILNSNTIEDLYNVVVSKKK